MTRVLSELLGAREPAFHLSLQQMERNAGRPSTDVRLSAEVLQGSQAKLRELGLDAHDTTGPELYAVLGERLRQGEKSFARALQAGSSPSDDPIAHVALTVERELSGQTCFALKTGAAKRLLKANVPKKTMKVLGYRSADSMLKHESAASLYAVATLVETEQWNKRLVASYTKLKVSDFENRQLSIEHPSSKRWQTLAKNIVAIKRHNILSFKELGAIVLLPLPARRPELVALTSTALTLHAANEIFAVSTFLKLHQVQANFGSVVKRVVLEEPMLGAKLLDQPLSWNTVQHFYARFTESVRADIFEPVLQAEDFAWHAVEDVFARIDPSFRFWQGTGHLGMLHGGTPVSYNLTDLILSHCNRSPFAARQVQYFRKALSNELTLRYLNPDRLGETVAAQFHKQIGMGSSTNKTSKLSGLATA